MAVASLRWNEAMNGRGSQGSKRTCCCEARLIALNWNQIELCMMSPVIEIAIDLLDSPKTIKDTDLVSFFLYFI